MEERKPLQQDESDQPVDIATLQASFKRAAMYSSTLTAIVTIIGSFMTFTDSLLALAYLPPAPKYPSPCSSATTFSAHISLGSGFPSACKPASPLPFLQRRSRLSLHILRIWVLMSGIFCVLLPIWESRGQIATIARGCWETMRSSLPH